MNNIFMADSKIIDSIDELGMHDDVDITEDQSSEVLIDEENGEMTLDINIGPIEPCENWTLPGRSLKRKVKTGMGKTGTGKDYDGNNLTGLVGSEYFEVDMAREDCGKLQKLGYSQAEKKYYPGFHHCYSRFCPICAGAWAKKQGFVIGSRLYSIQKAFGFKRMWHWVVSPPEILDSDYVSIWQYYDHIFRLFKTMYNNPDEDQPLGMYIIFHPFRNRDKEHHLGEWYYSPHFHVITNFAWNNDIGSYFKSFSCVIHRVKDPPEMGKKLDNLESYQSLVSYELRHAGLSLQKKRSQIGRWFGAWSYAKLTAIKVKVSQFQRDLFGEFIQKVKFDPTKVEFRRTEAIWSNSKIQSKCGKTIHNISSVQWRKTKKTFIMKRQYILVFPRHNLCSVLDYMKMYRLNECVEKEQSLYFDICKALGFENAKIDGWFK